MAITKIISAIHPSSGGGKYKVLRNTIEYILNPKKTENGKLVGSIGCFAENVLDAMMETQKRFEWRHKSLGEKERLGYHFTISFSPEEDVAPELALQVMKDFSEKLLCEEYEAVYSVHTDTEHMHGHLCFNSVNFKNGRKFRYENGDWARYIQPITDEICQKYGLHTLEMDTGKNLKEYEEQQKQEERCRYFDRLKRKEEQYLKKHAYHKDMEEDYSWNDHLRLLLDDIILHCSSMEEFYQQLLEKGITVKKGESQKHGTYLGLKAPGMEIHRRTYMLGREYTLDSIKQRIEMRNKPLPEYILPEDKMLVIPVRQFARYRQKRKLSPEMRRYFRRLYQLGIRPRSARITYQDIRDTRNAAEEMQRKLELVLEYRIGSEAAAQRAVTECENRRREIEEKLLQAKQRHSVYDEVLKKYYWYSKLKKQAEENGETEDIRQKLQKAQQSFEKYGFSEEEVEQYTTGKKAELKELKKALAEALTKQGMAWELLKEYQTAEVWEELTEDRKEEMEQFYESISEYEEYKEKSEQQKEAQKKEPGRRKI